MNKSKSNKGITLVALIITVIILLILTVAAIRAITGEGVLDKAKTATNSYEDKRREEENMLGSYADMIDANMPQNITTGEGNIGETSESQLIKELNDNNFFSNIQEVGEGNIVHIDSYYKSEINSKTYYLAVLEVSSEPYFLLITEENIYSIYMDQNTMQITELGDISESKVSNFTEQQIREDLNSVI